MYTVEEARHTAARCILADVGPMSPATAIEASSRLDHCISVDELEHAASDFAAENGSAWRHAARILREVTTCTRD